MNGLMARFLDEMERRYGVKGAFFLSSSHL